MKPSQCAHLPVRLTFCWFSLIVLRSVFEAPFAPETCSTCKSCQVNVCAGKSNHRVVFHQAPGWSLCLAFGSVGTKSISDASGICSAKHTANRTQNANHSEAPQQHLKMVASEVAISTTKERPTCHSSLVVSWSCYLFSKYHDITSTVCEGNQK